MTNPTPAALEPCPFCSADVDKLELDSGDESVCIRCRYCGAQSGRVYFGASEMESGIGEFSKAEADAAWNRRATRPAAEREPLTEARILKLWMKNVHGLHADIPGFARAIEAAHGIRADEGKTE